MDAPSDYKNAGIANIVSGAMNAMGAFVWIVSTIWFCVGIIWFIPLGIGVWQILVGLKMYNGEPQANAKTMTIAGLVAWLFNPFNLIGLGASVFAFMMLGKPEVVGYLESNS